MKPKPFEELLAGATPGLWYASEHNKEGIYSALPQGKYRLAECEVNDWNRESPIISRETARTNAAYIARCSPAVMREVWGALKSARFVEGYDSRGMRCERLVVDKRLFRRALAALNGEKPDRKED